MTKSFLKLDELIFPDASSRRAEPHQDAQPSLHERLRARELPDERPHVRRRRTLHAGHAHERAHGPFLHHRLRDGTR